VPNLKCIRVSHEIVNRNKGTHVYHASQHPPQKFPIPIGVLKSTPGFAIVRCARVAQLLKAASSLKLDGDILQAAWCNNIRPIESSQKYHETGQCDPKLLCTLGPSMIMVVPELQYFAVGMNCLIMSDIVLCFLLFRVLNAIDFS
jgi:hypothetical protein